MSVSKLRDWAPLDEVFELLLEFNPKVSRNAVYRCLVREGLNKVPKEVREKAKKFKEYDPGYLHIDVTYLPKFEGKKFYLFVAIDRANRLMFFKVYETKSAQSTDEFMDECLAFFLFEITHILTDNGLEFTNRLLKSKKGNSCEKKSLMDVKCEKENIDHRLIKPYTPKTNAAPACPAVSADRYDRHGRRTGLGRKSKWDNQKQNNSKIQIRIQY